MSSRYEVVQAAAGEGGFGRVDRAMDNELERQVAIKTLDPLFKDSPSEQDIERFRREAKALARLSHPNIPAIYDIQLSESSGEFRIIFEWIDGRTLSRHLQDSGVLSVEVARQLFSRLCSALSHAHTQGMIHRDIKPSNILLDQDIESCYLVDFGIALRQEDLSRITDTGGRLGTPGYMSPEQERGDELTSASDIFSLGIVLYETLAGSHPSIGAYKPLSIVNESIPPSIDELIQESFREDPRRRPSADEFDEKLAAALRPHSNFTAVLASGSLLEIQLALGGMDPVGFAALPEGQRVLLVTRVIDLISVDEARMRNAVAALLAQMARLAHETDAERYASIVQQTFEYGYEKQYGDAWLGNDAARRSLGEVALACGSDAHGIVADEVLSRLEGPSLEDKPGWYYHDLRILLQNLLTNPDCATSRAGSLGAGLSRINEISH